MKDAFLLDPATIFLNHGSFGACPREVLEAQQAWQREMERNPVAVPAALAFQARNRWDRVFVRVSVQGYNSPEETRALATALERYFAI